MSQNHLFTLKTPHPLKLNNLARKCNKIIQKIGICLPQEKVFDFSNTSQQDIR